MLQTVESFLSESLLGGLLEAPASGDWRESLAGFSQFLEETILTDFPTFIVSLVEKFDAGIITILLVAAA